MKEIYLSASIRHITGPTHVQLFSEQIEVVAGRESTGESGRMAECGKGLQTAAFTILRT
jgi:hypothetical protein